ncbi:MAG TPA: aminoglycoside phosphotransferase family protein [Streptosporangiaceae bacterium]|nr:aminoglycoside phosphotransferase family protein [Streptosporangiaceae bacterium]
MVRSTHDLTFTDDRVVKRYRSWHRGEPDREWSGLGLLHWRVPGLAPQPLQRRADSGVPVIVMTRVVGEPLGTAKLSPAQVGALAETLTRMHAAVPDKVLKSLPERQWVGRQRPGELPSMLRSWAHATPRLQCPVAAQALAVAAAWLDTTDLSLLSEPPGEQVFTHGDGNLGNFLWDGVRCRVVDFEDCGVCDPVYEVADLLEHVSVRLHGLVEPDDLIEAVGLSQAQQARLLTYRRLMAVYWLLMLLPGNPGHHRNPVGSLEQQAAHVTQLL